jgi:GTP cyclohydrolase II
MMARDGVRAPGAVVVPPPHGPRLRARVRVPLTLDGGLYDGATMVTFHGICDGREHLAILFGDPQSVPAPLVRVHSECLTGDIFGSARCDCGPQLRDALRILRREGGIVLYLRQEGRGIGLYNKLDAYRLQDVGYDTFEANRALHFADDLRDYRAAAEMLHSLGVSRIRLLSNNPDKAAQLRLHGVDVCEERSTGVFLTEANERYLRAKVRSAGHLIRFDTAEPEECT